MSVCNGTEEQCDGCGDWFEDGDLSESHDGRELCGSCLSDLIYELEQSMRYGSN